MSTQTKVEQRLSAVENRLDRLEDLLVGISQKLDQKPAPTEINEEKGEALKGWVTDYVSMRLQQLVPETCDHPAEANPDEGTVSRQHLNPLHRRGRPPRQTHPHPVCARDGCAASRRQCSQRQRKRGRH